MGSWQEGELGSLTFYKCFCVAFRLNSSCEHSGLRHGSELGHRYLRLPAGSRRDPFSLRSVMDRPD